LTAEAARLVVPNLLLGNTILLTNTRSYPQQAQRIGEIIDAGELPPGSRSECSRCWIVVMG
jgi:acyl-CoA reductase-like NAD-dependent aldehyde dehydrogenase